jgi:uncharacterized protein YecT (DUF1311 family)
MMELATKQMKFFSILFGCIIYCSSMLAFGEKIEGDTSPDQRYIIKRLQDEGVYFIEKKTGRKFGLLQGEGEPPSESILVKWSKDSSFAAVVSRGRRFDEVYIFKRMPNGYALIESSVPDPQELYDKWSAKMQTPVMALNIYSAVIRLGEWTENMQIPVAIECNSTVVGQSDQESWILIEYNLLVDHDRVKMGTSEVRIKNEVIASAERIYKKADTELNVVYKKMLSKLPPGNIRTDFINAQKAWVVFRDLEAKSRAGISSQGGSSYSTDFLSVMAELTTQRVLQLKSIEAAL